MEVDGSTGKGQGGRDGHVRWSERPGALENWKERGHGMVEIFPREVHIADHTRYDFDLGYSFCVDDMLLYVTVVVVVVAGSVGFIAAWQEGVLVRPIWLGRAAIVSTI